ncbi:hypothetical protein Sjap_003244 [Stephania japonica]|uniref:Uncharacterized protein n=1 Tax=Stephania japonica TaxID=461633 RepID=A0AAP0KQ46_9MAGN
MMKDVRMLTTGCTPPQRRTFRRGHDVTCGVQTSRHKAITPPKTLPTSYMCIEMRVAGSHFTNQASQGLTTSPSTHYYSGTENGH